MVSKQDDRTEETIVCDISVYIKNIRRWTLENNVSPYKLATECSLSASTLQHMYSPEWNPTFNTLRSIETFMCDYDHSKSGSPSSQLELFQS
jgi:hypothetical protein